uniref:Prefoldin subunit 6 n=1 Tax=Astyanax mexicanus TaxID=7994 RepID=A0A8B9LIJ5_ASTMX
MSFFLFLHRCFCKVFGSTVNMDSPVMICCMCHITDVSKSMSARQKLEAQLTENNIVKEELHLLDSQNTVYKLIGPVLVKQDLDEAKATVGKRLEYINGEIQRYETLLKDMERKSEQHREVLASLQQEYQRAQGIPVAKA